ncbi:FkbM family methyltransferase [Jannaschia ovalis]|uniref:FkbM family methyltransferase n=1 Tax=Jannaschia ovalis TaxID=3038773 RepID=A0ABY8LEI7_9RHOB|nr:FkbM family methyltransferase [Jannaschia sp. GRR-S6-38]WGH79735.1 FkbM family methyltransferase [Jannaschia sp. GRR-S6-38]
MRRAFKRWIARTFNTWRAPAARALQDWSRDGGEALRMRFPGLGPADTVLDFGGFEGAWAARLHDAHGCRVHVFEPHPAFIERLRHRFAGNAAVMVHPFAVGRADGVLPLSDDGDASSALSGKGAAVKGEIRAAARVFADLPEDRFAVAKINIEGGEYDLLPALIEAGILDRIDRLQVQFHLYTRADLDRRARLVAAIERTHASDWSYPFVWEQWSRRDA